MTKFLKWSDFAIAIAGASVTIGFYIFLALSSIKWMMFVGKYFSQLCSSSIVRGYSCHSIMISVVG